MDKTTNYKLPQWVKEDAIKMEDFNSAFSTLDAELKAAADAAAGAASAESVTAVQQSVNALAQTITKSKMCRVKYDSYTGSGKNGSANPNTVSCDFYPVLFGIWDGGNTVQLVVRGNGTLYNSLGQNSTLNWKTDGLSWYCNSASYGYAPSTIQYNTSGTKYYYIVLGYDQ